VFLLLVLGLGIEYAAAQTSSPSPAVAPAVAAPATPFGQSAQNELTSLISAGSFADLRWPNFSDYKNYVQEFYQEAGWSPGWVAEGQPTPQAQAMITQFKQATQKGLNPEDYDASRWDGRVAKLKPATSAPADSDLAHFDLAMTVCAMRFISDLHIGRVNPQHFKFDLVGPKHYDLPTLLRNQFVNASDINAEVAKVEPPYDGYERAKVALAAYLVLAAQGDGPALPAPAKSVRPGGSYPAVSQLATRLRQLGDLSSSASVDATSYDGAVVDGVKHFQERHGLEPDGVLGAGTVVELNTPLSERTQELEDSLERYRWIPHKFPQPPIVVNIPEFRLRTMRKQPGYFLSMRVIVGKSYRHHTPVFADMMRYLIFRPYWNVPPSIARAELIPKVRRDPNYLATHNFGVYTNAGTLVTDGQVSGDVMRGLNSGAYNIRQKPGPKNALGLVKFIFPNDYNVYLHSTPAQELFKKARRDFSHGCIRVEDPVALAAWVLRDKPEWTVDKIRATMNGDQTVQVNLDKPIPVLILYETAVVEPDGEVHFFDDIYGYDADLQKALAAGYPYPS
jgi:murein L,D-transpeptidase YcbB/YkuD